MVCTRADAHFGQLGVSPVIVLLGSDGNPLGSSLRAFAFQLPSGVLSGARGHEWFSGSLCSIQKSPPQKEHRKGRSTSFPQTSHLKRNACLKRCTLITYRRFFLKSVPKKLKSWTERNKLLQKLSRLRSRELFVLWVYFSSHSTGF